MNKLKNKYELCKYLDENNNFVEYYIIHLNSKKNPGKLCLIDKEDFEKVIPYSWSPNFIYKKQKLFYAVAWDSEKKSAFYMHRLLKPEYKIVDHKKHNQDVLDNRKENLREVNAKQNSHNSRKQSGTKYKYIGINKRDNLYFAKLNGEAIAYTEKEEEAAFIRDLFIILEHGEYASLNFPDFFKQVNFSKFFISRLIDNIKNKTNYIKNKEENNYSSKYIGVSYNKLTKKWEANVKHKQKKFYLGLFPSEIEAAIVRDKKAVELQGKNAKLNFS